MDTNVTTPFCFPVCSVGSVQLPLTWLTAVQCWGQYRQASLWSQLGQVTFRIFTRDQTQHSAQSTVRLVRLSRTVIDPVWPNCLCVSVSSVIMILRLLFCDVYRVYTIIRQLWSSLTDWIQLRLNQSLSDFCRGTCRILVLATSVFQKTVNKISCDTKSKREAGVDSYMSFSDFFRNGRTFYLTMKCQ